MPNSTIPRWQDLHKRELHSSNPSSFLPWHILACSTSSLLCRCPLVTIISPHHAPKRHTHRLLPFRHQPITPDSPLAHHNLLYDLKSQPQIDIPRLGRRGFSP